MPDVHSFREFELGPEIQTAIRDMGIEVPSPIQKLSIAPALEGRDIIAKAETGTGKTLAFGAPMMARIDPARASVLALVLCPTRELAQQVADVLTELGIPRGVRTALIVGGDPIMPQVKALKAGAQVVVGTPGRVLDLYQQKFLSFPWAEFAVLDEADKMFEIGFLDDVRKILSYMPDERQTMLFSATYPREVLKLARESTRDPVEIATAKGAATVDSIDQMYMKIDDDDKSLALIRTLEQSEQDDVFLIFCDRRTDVDRLMRRLERTRFPVKALHGGYDQAARFRVMSAFRTGEVKALVATDVASRGLDVAHVTHVVNYGVPRELEEYTHRIGRTGRAGRSGTAITFVSRRDFGRWKLILKKSGWDVLEIDAPGRSNDRRPAAEDRPRRAPRTEEARPERKRERSRRENESDDRPRARRREREEEERPRRVRERNEERRAPSEQSEDRPRRKKRRRSQVGEERSRREPAENKRTRDEGDRQKRSREEESRPPRRRSRDEGESERPRRRRRPESDRAESTTESTEERRPRRKKKVTSSDASESSERPTRKKRVRKKRPAEEGSNAAPAEKAPQKRDSRREPPAFGAGMD